MAKFCSNCGAALEGTEKFCASCGTPVMDAPQQEKEESQERQNPPMERQAPPPMHHEVPGQPMMQQNAFGQGAPQYGYGAAGMAAFAGEAYVPDEGLVQMFLRYDNRLNRKRYLMRGLALFVAIIVGCTALGVVLALAGASDSAIGTLSTLIGFACAVPGCMLAIRRLHDLDRPTWWIIGNFIPIVNIALGFYLIFCKGTDGPNQYGPDPLEGRR